MSFCVCIRGRAVDRELEYLGLQNLYIFTYKTQLTYLNKWCRRGIGQKAGVMSQEEG